MTLQKKVLVIGLGQSGKATTQYFLRKGYAVVGVDAQHESVEIKNWRKQYQNEALSIESDQTKQDIASYEYAIVSPGISQKHPLYHAAIEQHIPVFSEAQLVLRELKNMCIGITGTNGKTTLTLFIEHLLNTAGMSARAIGNVGYPFTQYISESSHAAHDILVCELSSYHLETLSAKALDIGILLQMTPDHLDRYGSFNEYAHAKLNMVACIKPKPHGVLFVHPQVYYHFKKELEACEGDVIMIPELFVNNHKDSYLQLTKNKEYCGFLDLVKEKAVSLETLYLGKAIAELLSITDEDLARALETFVKPPHRLEYVATIRGVRFINDSKATNIESVVHAIKTIDGNILLIAGGKDKGLHFEEWKTRFDLRVRKVFVIGECAHRIQSALQDAYNVEICRDLEEATRKAFACAKANENILLSPGCASFDSYRNYMHRGECFREIVTALNKESAR